jgi:hypothetical protein
MFDSVARRVLPEPQLQSAGFLGSHDQTFGALDPFEVFEAELLEGTMQPTTRPGSSSEGSRMRRPFF